MIARDKGIIIIAQVTENYYRSLYHTEWLYEVYVLLCSISNIFIKKKRLQFILKYALKILKTFH